LRPSQDFLRLPVRKNPFKQLFPTEVDGEKRGYPLTNPVGTKRRLI
jgi:hypothetical protein